jgi:hypothetical protein
VRKAPSDHPSSERLSFAARTPPNKALNRTVNSSVQLTLGAVWRHTWLAGSEPVNAVASRLTPIRWAALRPSRYARR